MGSRGHQQEVAGNTREEFAQFVTLCFPNFPTKERSGHLVGLIADDQIPISLLEFLLEVVITAEFIKSGNDQTHFGEGVAGAGRFDAVVGEDIEGKVKFVM